MPNPVFIGVGRFRGQWDANANDLYQTNGTSAVETGTALTDGDWANSMDSYVGYTAGEGPQVGDYLKIKTAGTTTIDGHSDWREGDWCVYTTGSVWRKISRADAIAAVVVGDTNTGELADALLTGSHSRWEQQVLFVSGNCPTASFTGSNSFTYQYATDAETGYSALRLTGNLLVDGQIQAKQINTVYHSRSIMYESGSTRFGDSTYDLHEFSGSLRVNSSLSGTSEWTGSLEFDGDISGAAGHKITYPYITASAGVSTSQIGMVGDNDQIVFGSGRVTISQTLSASAIASTLIWGQNTNHASLAIGYDGTTWGADAIRVGTGADPCLLTGSTVSASIGMYTPQIGVSGDDDLLGLAADTVTLNGNLTGSSGAQLQVPIMSASSKVVTSQIGPPGDAHLLSLADGAVSGSPSSKLTIPAITASYGITVPQIGPTGDEDLLALASGVVTVNGKVSASGVYATQIGLSGDDDLMGLASGVLTVNGAVSASGVYAAQIGVSGDDDLLALSSDTLTINGNLSASQIYGDAGSNLTIRSQQSLKIHLDDDDNSNFRDFTIYDGDDNVLFSIVEDDPAITYTSTMSASLSVQRRSNSELTLVTVYNQDATADTDGKVSVGWAMADSLTGAQLQAAKIRAEKEQTWDMSGGGAGIDASLVFQTTNSNSLADRMIIKSDGKVGIGIADPDSYVDEKDNLVVGSTVGNTGMTLVSSPTAITTIQFRGNTTVNDKEGWIDYSQNTERMRFGTAGLNTRMTIDSAGNVGIGANPEGKLHVYTGDAGIAPSALADELVVEGDGSTGISILTPNDQVGRLYFGDSDNAARAYVLYDHSVDMMKFSIASGNKLVIDNSGQVGIGVEDPDSKLEVAGKIHISGEQGSAPSAPSDGDGGYLYAKADGKIYWRSNELTETDLTTGGGGGGGSIDGSGATNRISFWSDSDTLSSDANFTWTDGSDLLTMSGTLLLTSNTTTDHRVSGSLLLKTDSTSDPGSNDTGFCVRGDGAGSQGRAIATVDNNNNGLLVLSASGGKTMFRAGATTETAPHADYNIDRARKFILSGSTFIGSSGQTQTNVDTHDVWGHFYCTSGSIRIMSGATGRQDDFYGINLPNHADKLGSIRANAFPTYSSIRWKYNVEAINEPLTRINQLRGVFFDWKETGKSDMGFIAEEVGEVLPRIVRFEEDGINAESLDYGKIIPLCVEAIKALSAKNEALEKQLNDIKKKL